MDFKKGDYVVYAGNEVCVYSGIVEKCFDGINKVNYCMLVPVYSSNSAYYLPELRQEEKIRHLLSKEQIEEIISQTKGQKLIWENDKNNRKLEFTKIIKSNDFKQIFMMLKTIYDQRIALEQKGKKLFSADEKAFNEAERLIRQEFSIVLELKEYEVDEYLRKCFGN